MPEYVEQFALLFRSALLWSKREQRPLCRREWIDFQWPGIRRGTQAKATECMTIQSALLVHRVVMLLVNRELQARAAGETGNCLRAFKHRPMLSIHQHRQTARQPTSLVRFPINHVRNSEPRTLGIRRGATKLYLVRHRRVRECIRLACEFLQIPAAFFHQPRTAISQVRMREYFQTETG